MLKKRWCLFTAEDGSAILLLRPNANVVSMCNAFDSFTSTKSKGTYKMLIDSRSHHQCLWFSGLQCMCCCAGIAEIAIGRHVQCVNNITARLLPGNKRVESCCYTVVYENDLLVNQTINQSISRFSGRWWTSGLVPCRVTLTSVMGLIYQGLMHHLKALNYPQNNRLFVPLLSYTGFIETDGHFRTQNLYGRMLVMHNVTVWGKTDWGKKSNRTSQVAQIQRHIS